MLKGQSSYLTDAKVSWLSCILHIQLDVVILLSTQKRFPACKSTLNYLDRFGKTVESASGRTDTPLAFLLCILNWYRQASKLELRRRVIHHNLTRFQLPTSIRNSATQRFYQQIVPRPVCASILVQQTFLTSR